MSYQLIFHPEAEKEYLNSFIWYEQSLEGLGYRFEKEIEKRLLDIAAHPQFYSKKKGRFREVSVKVFLLLLFTL
jgi:hypothetical protein